MSILPDNDDPTAAWVHWGAAVFFAVQVPPSLALYYLAPGVFESVWKPYLVFLSLWALVSTHWTGFLSAQAREAARAT